MIKKLLFNATLLGGVLLYAHSNAIAQGSWQQLGTNINGIEAGDNFGTTLHFSASGNTFAAASVNDGSSGSLKGQVRVFSKSGSTWVQKGSNLVGDANGDFFGRSIGLDSAGNTIVIGGPYNDAGLGSFTQSGHVKVYSWNGSAWQQKGSTLLADTASENFGYAVSISYDGNTVAIGIPFNSDSLALNRGSVKIYRWISNNWVQIGNEIAGTIPLDIFGSAVSLNRTGNIVAIGAPFHTDSIAGPQVGLVRIYQYNASSWTQLGNDIIGDSADYSGTTLSLSADGDRIAIGSPQDIIFGGYGIARVYELNTNVWTQMGADLKSSLPYDGFSKAISLSGDGNMLAVGAPDNVTDNENGRTEIFSWTGSTWQQAGDTLKGDNSGDLSGAYVSLSYSGKYLGIGAPSNSNNGNLSGQVKLFSYCVSNSSSVNITSCNGPYTSPSGKHIWNVGGTYMDTITNSSGCDSILTIYLTIGTSPVVNLGSDISQCKSSGPVMLDAGNPGSKYLWSNNDTTSSILVSNPGTYFVKVTNNGCSGYDTINVSFLEIDTALIVNTYSITAVETGATYQWLDCDNGMQPIADANQKSITLYGCVGDDFNYAVEITKNGCKDTSYCRTVTLTRLQKGAAINADSASHKSGTSVSLSADGNTMAIGAPSNRLAGQVVGSVKVFTWNGSVWIQKGATIYGKAALDAFGQSVSLSADGNRVAIGSPGNDENGSNAGQVRIFEWSGSSWAQLGADINGETAADESGLAIALDPDGNTIIIGSPKHIGNGTATTPSGKAIVYVWNGSSWIKRGNNLNGEFEGELYGYSVACVGGGNWIAIGGPGYSNGSSVASGIVRTYQWDGNSWALRGGNAQTIGNYGGDFLGNAISYSADGSSLAMGALYGNSNGVSSGYVKVMRLGANGNWEQKGADIAGQAGSQFGSSIALSADGNRIAIGAPNDSSMGINAGQISIYSWDGTAWIKSGDVINGEMAEDLFGYSVALSSNSSTVAAGAPENNNTAGNVRIFQDCNVLTGIADEEIKEATTEIQSSFVVYPNPNNGSFTLKTNGTLRAQGVEVYNAMGQLVFKADWSDNSTEIKLSLNTEPAGIYFVKVNTAQGSQTQRLIIQR